MASLTQVLLLDLDGTLVDDVLAECRGIEAYYSCFKERLPDCDKHEFAGRWTRASARHWARYSIGELTFQEQRRERIREVMGECLPESIADHLFSVYLKAYEAAWTLYLDAKTFLNRYPTYPKAIVTNGDRTGQRLKVERVGLDALLPFVVTPEDAGGWKPDAAMFLHAAHLFGATPGQCTMLGDDLRKDVIPAMTLGMRAVWINRDGKSLPADITDTIEQVSTLAEVKL
ncbi:MAG: HAD family hydrolase [Verrucomicrobiota bacterium]|nr:HAD family hydrolase [Verrucomicrobiota bacterium]